MSGKAHSDTDIMIEHVESRTLFLGDNGFNKRMGRFDNSSSMHGNITALEQVKPLDIAEDFMVWNVTKDAIRVRDAIPNEDAWPPPAAQKKPDVDRSIAVDVSAEIKAGAFDVYDADQPTYDAINEKYGTPTILVNNAGITRDNLLMRMKEEEWQAIMDTNLTSVYRVSKACLRGMMKAKFGRIINIASVVGASGNAGQTNYSAAKAGIFGFTKSLAQEVGSRGITVNSVAPGFIDTDMTRELPEEQRQALLSAIPLARLGQPAEIAAVVAFLASEGAAYVTGETLHVNGGMYMS